MTTHRMNGRIVWGLILVALGILFLLDQLDVADAGDTIGTWWPMILIVIGGWGLVTSPGRNLGALILLLVGVTLQVDELDLLDTSVWDVAWPVALIAVGLWLVLRRPWGRPGPGTSSTETASGDDLDLFSLLAGRNQRISSRSWRGGEVTAILGGAEVHLDDAMPVEGGARLQATAIMGGVEVFIPAGWDVDLRGTPLLGGIEDKRRRVAANGDVARPKLRIDATAIMGGIELKDA